MLTDTQLQHDVQDELEWDPSVDAAQIGVTAKDGVVTLTGHAAKLADKLAAERLAKRVYGTRAVANDIEVLLPRGSERTDTDIAGAALTALKWDSLVPDDRITVTVRHGFITLEGTVHWQYQKEAATRAVHNLIGVKGVSNQIVVTPTAKSAEIKDRIEAAFKRSAEVDARKITVEVTNGKVMLRGRVRSWSERDEALRAAWAAPGVTDVDDRLDVAL